MKKIMLNIFALLLLCAVTAFAGGTNYIEQEDLKKLIESKTPVKIVDIQPQSDFRKHHIPGAIETNAFPVKSADDKAKLDKIIPQLSAGREDIVIVCPRGGSGAKNTFNYLKEKGIPEKRLFILEDGMAGWKYNQLTVSGK